VTLIGLVAVLGACGSDTESTTSAASPTSPASIETAPVTQPAPTTEPAPTTKGDVAEVTADDIPISYTPTGGWTEMPPPVLATCTEPLADGAVDMRGTWVVVSVDVGGVDDPTHGSMGEIQRIEQCGDRVVITAGGIIHDMRADGNEEGAVRDVAAADKTTPITVIASFEDGVNVLRPVGVDAEVTRTIHGEQLVWGYVGFTARLDRIGDA
jgi:hypothetical protein